VYPRIAVLKTGERAGIRDLARNVRYLKCHAAGPTDSRT
jgi:hypothetical protein